MSVLSRSKSYHERDFFVLSVGTTVSGFPQELPLICHDVMSPRLIIARKEILFSLSVPGEVTEFQ